MSPQPQPQMVQQPAYQFPDFWVSLEMSKLTVSQITQDDNLINMTSFSCGLDNVNCDCDCSLMLVVLS